MSHHLDESSAASKPADAESFSDDDPRRPKSAWKSGRRLPQFTDSADDDADIETLILDDDGRGGEWSSSESDSEAGGERSDDDDDGDDVCSVVERLSDRTVPHPDRKMSPRDTTETERSPSDQQVPEVSDEALFLRWQLHV